MNFGVKLLRAPFLGAFKSLPWNTCIYSCLLAKVKYLLLNTKIGDSNTTWMLLTHYKISNLGWNSLPKDEFLRDSYFYVFWIIIMKENPKNMDGTDYLKQQNTNFIDSLKIDTQESQRMNSKWPYLTPTSLLHWCCHHSGVLYAGSKMEIQSCHFATS